MVAITISNTFLVTVIIGYIVFRLLCEFGRESHLRPRKPSDIHFTSAMITSDITGIDGVRVPLKSFIDELLLHGDHLAMIVDPIRIYYDSAQQRWRSIDNRRLYALRKAEQRGAVSTVRYTVIDPSSRSEGTGNCDSGTNGVPLIREVPGFEWDRSCNLD